MAPADIFTSVCVLSLGGIIVGTGLWCLDRRDRLRIAVARQASCRWHRWQPSMEGIWLVCSVCGKRSLGLNPREEESRALPPPDHLFP
jgi:hypothetical protein